MTSGEKWHGPLWWQYVTWYAGKLACAVAGHRWKHIGPEAHISPWGGTHRIVDRWLCDRCSRVERTDGDWEPAWWRR